MLYVGDLRFNLLMVYNLEIYLKFTFPFINARKYHKSVN
jgi:hypothetical protein